MIEVKQKDVTRGCEGILIVISQENIEKYSEHKLPGATVKDLTLEIFICSSITTDVCILDLWDSPSLGISDLLPVLKLTVYAIVVVVVYLTGQTILLLDFAQYSISHKVSYRLTDYCRSVTIIANNQNDLFHSEN